MSIKVTFEFESEAEAIAFLQGSDAPASGDKPKRGRPTKAAAAPESPAAPTGPAAVAAATSSPATTAAPPAPASAVPFKDVVDAITALADIDMGKAKGVLGKYGVAQASLLKPEQFAGVVADCKALMPPQPAASSLI